MDLKASLSPEQAGDSRPDETAEREAEAMF